MLIIPAIDIKNGQCVRLRQGRMEDDTVFSDDPVAVARQWVGQGARRLHLVDLDGAFAGQPKNASLVHRICAEFPDLPVQIGGGIRDMAIAEAYLEAGVQFVIIGTAAVKQPQFVHELCAAHPGHVIVGLDASEGRVATEGWADVSDDSAVELGQRFEGAGVTAIVYTDIGRDGMMAGFNVEATAALGDALSIPVIASGGVSSLADIHALNAIAAHNVVGAIVGRALYEGTLDLPAAQALLDQVGPQAGQLTGER